MLYKKNSFVCLLFILSVNALFAKPPKVLVFSKTTFYYHESIPAGIAAIQLLGKQMHFDVDTTKDAAAFTDENLKQYAAVIFLSTSDTSGALLNDAQQTALMHFIESGKGYVGIHAASDAEYQWPWYNKLVGAYFKSHPKQQEAELNVTDSSFIATKKLPSSWKHFDEWYNYKQANWSDVHIVLTVNEKSYTGGENGDYHPVCWYHDYDGGRSFYLGLGHTNECYKDPLFLQLLAGGIKYAISNREK
jgi:type 1 glutamine amidotransferase